MPTTFPSRSIEIAEEFARLRHEKNARHRDIAQQLHISEGELIAALKPVSEVTALTRNASCVHEKTGVYREWAQGFAMLKKYSVSREKVAIMAFVGNPGMIQIHSGPVHKNAVMESWITILDPRFNLREGKLCAA